MGQSYPNSSEVDISIVFWHSQTIVTLELVTAGAGAIFVFCLVLLLFGDGRGGGALPAPKNPIGFAPSP